MSNLSNKLLAVLLLLLASPVAGADGVKSPAEIFETVAPSVVVVTAHSSQWPDRHGSGFVIGEDGVIITNLHTVAGAEDVIVKLKDGRTFPATAVTIDDAERDLCVLKLNASDLPTVLFGDPDTMKPGEEILVIGSPLGLEWSISNGLFSGKRIFGSVEYLQFSAPLSPGDSGAPLVSMTGHVVGIATISLTTLGSERIQNLNFAVSIKEIKDHIRTDRTMSLKEFSARNRDYHPDLILDKAYSRSAASGESSDHSFDERRLKDAEFAFVECRRGAENKCVVEAMDVITIYAPLSAEFLAKGDVAMAGFYGRKGVDILESFGGGATFYQQVDQLVQKSSGSPLPKSFRESIFSALYFAAGVNYALGRDKAGALSCLTEIKTLSPNSDRVRYLQAVIDNPASMAETLRQLQIQRSAR